MDKNTHKAQAGFIELIVNNKNIRHRKASNTRKMENTMSYRSDK